MREFQLIDTEIPQNLTASSPNLKRLANVSTTPIY